MAFIRFHGNGMDKIFIAARRCIRNFAPVLLLDTEMLCAIFDGTMYLLKPMVMLAAAVIFRGIQKKIGAPGALVSHGSFILEVRRNGCDGSHVTRCFAVK